MEIHRSARKHGIAEEDTIYALEYAMVVVELEPGSVPPRVLTIGPDRAGNPLEVIILHLGIGKSSSSTPCHSVDTSTTCSLERIWAQ